MMRRQRLRRTNTLLAFCAGVASALALTAGACGTSPSPAEPGGSKGPEINEAVQGHRVAGGASSQSTSVAPFAGTPVIGGPVPAVAGCGLDLPCVGTVGCTSACDPASLLLTTCARCQNGAFASCTQDSCQP
jgi:hypothetical protein